MEMKTGAAISGSIHGALIALAVFGGDLFGADDEQPLVLSEVSVISGTQFEAALSTAPTIPTDSPTELAAPQPTERDLSFDSATDIPADFVDPSEVVTPETPTSVAARPEIVLPRPRLIVPEEPARPSFAEIAAVEVLPRQAAVPESQPSTEPVQPLASAPAPLPSDLPKAPPVLEEAPAEETAEEEPKEEADPESTAEAQPDAPEADVPAEARIPVARPADLAAAALAARETARARAEEEKDEENQEEEPEPQTAAAEEPQEQPSQSASGGSAAAFAATVTRGEKDALRVGIKQHFTYAGNRADRALAVTIGIRLSEAGRIVDGPELIRAQGGNQSSQRALFQAGRRALLKAQNAGEFEKLPKDKHQAWQLIHVTFTPEEIGFSS